MIPTNKNLREVHEWTSVHRPITAKTRFCKEWRDREILLGYSINVQIGRPIDREFKTVIHTFIISFDELMRARDWRSLVAFRIREIRKTVYATKQHHFVPYHVDDLVKTLFKLRSICVCDNPTPTRFDPLDNFCKCGNCKRDLSKSRAMEI